VKPFSQACENNREPILQHLREAFATVRRVLEIGSGTGQHAVYFAPALPQLEWQCSDCAPHLPGICAWLTEQPAPNLPEPVELDVNWREWPVSGCDAAFSANTLHIMHWPEVEAMFEGLGRHLAADARLAIYGPFMVDGRHTAPSNEEFDTWLRYQDPGRGVRERTEVDRLAAAQGFEVLARHDMPANNQLLLWTRGRSSRAGSG
jgi:hypothetical protein